MIKPRPESTDTLRRRYPAALSRTFDVDATRCGSAEGVPSLCRANVFDTLDGVRLIVSVTRLADFGRFLHVSVSLLEGLDWFNTLTIVSQALGPEVASARLKALAERKYAEISGDAEPLTFRGFLPGDGIPHWFRMLPDDKETNG